MRSRDTILVQINPVERPGTPRSARDILNRLNEVSFNAVLLKELRMIALLRQVADPGSGEGALWAGMRIHRVRKRNAWRTSAIPRSSMPNGTFSRCCATKAGRAADAFLTEHRRISGNRSTLDIDSLLQAV